MVPIVIFLILKKRLTEPNVVEATKRVWNVPIFQNYVAPAEI